MADLVKAGGYLLSPLTFCLALWLLAALTYANGRHRATLALATTGFVVLWIGSAPAAAYVLAHSLEGRYPPAPVESMVPADAIVVLGGALIPPAPPQRPHFAFGPAAGRVWHAARLYKAGKAKWIVVAGGNQPSPANLQPEAEAIAELLVLLGVPPASIVTETLSSNTRENAANTEGLLRRLGVRTVLLVTSAQHMPRAVKTFRKVWTHSALEVIPAATDLPAEPDWNSPWVWIPSPNSLLSVSRALKEYAGMVVLEII